MTSIRTARAFASILTPAFLAMAGAGLAPSAAQAATEETQPQQADVYEQLYDALIGGVDTHATVDNQIETLKHTLVTQDPNIAFANELKPGIIDRFGEAMRPWLLEHSTRVLAAFRPRFVAIFREELGAEDTATMLAFYTSPLGRKILLSVSQNYTGSNTLGDINDFSDGDVIIDAADVEKDIATAAMRTAAQITPEDIASDTSGFLTNAALIEKMAHTNTKVTALRVEMEQVQPDPDIAEGLIRSLEAIFDEIAPELKPDGAE
ncbi:MAG TPA: DUF2059 domain-containing protein [Sphingomonadaceae bacterium]|nr:DUF2059 domain-containing protein [Sphingomonadaceae bacterium]